MTPVEDKAARRGVEGSEVEAGDYRAARERPGRPMAHFFQEGKAKLDHPRKTLWRWIFSYLTPHKRKLGVYFLLLLFGTIVMSVTPLLTAKIIDAGIVGNDPDLVVRLVTLYIVLMLLMAVGTYVGWYGMGRLGQHVTFEVRNDVFERLQEMSMNYFDKNPSGDIISRATNDVDQLNLLVGGQLVQIVSSVISLVLGVVLMFLLNPFLAIFGVMSLPMFLLLMRWFRKRVIGAFKDTRKKISKVTSSIQENITGAKVVQAYGQERKASDEFDRANLENYAAQVRVRRMFATFFPLVSVMSTLITVVVLLMGGFMVLGVIRIGTLTVTVGVLTAFIQYLANFFRPFMTLTQIQQIIESAMASSDRIYTIVTEEADLPDPDDPVDLGDVKGHIEYDGVSFGYRFDGGEGPAGKGRAKSPAAAGSARSPAKLPPGMPPGSHPGMPAGVNPAEVMRRVQEFVGSLPEPYRGYFTSNMGSFPPALRRELVMGLMGVPREEAPAEIDSILARHGHAVPGTEHAAAHPELSTAVPGAGGDNRPTNVPPTVLARGVPGSGGVERPSSTGPSPAGGMFNPQLLKRMVKVLARSLEGGASLPGGGGGGMGGEMGGGGAGMGGGMPGMKPQQILRMLATAPLPEEMTEDFPEVVKRAIEEERVLIQREANVGYVLKDVNQDIKPGSTVAIVGKTGAGKTTLVKLLCRFYDVTEGSIRVDGVDVRDIRKADLRRGLGLVPQDSFLFTGTIRENLLYGRPDGGGEDAEWERRMVEVSKFLGLHNFVQTLPKGYDTVLKENASNISIGQRQLIAFARALIQDPKVLILDEATSSVDPYTETLIQDALERARRGRTTIIIAHRLSTVKNADWIVVLDQEAKGIVEQGTHEELVAKGGVYKSLLEMQYRDVGNAGA
ncbi:MAG: ABC transporter transmembrane domain-containing protein [Promethearchaeota archaeon]